MRVNSQVSKERSECLHALTRKIAKKRNSIWQDWQGEIVIDEIGKVRQGRNYAYKPVVISSTTTTTANDRQILLGDKMRVKIYDFSNFSLKAKIIL
jgi:tRNA A37 methylthiotransferase MiaB